MTPLNLTIEVTVDFEQEHDGSYVAWMREVNGVIACGETIDETMDEIKKIYYIKRELINRRYEI